LTCSSMFLRQKMTSQLCKSHF